MDMTTKSRSIGLLLAATGTVWAGVAAAPAASAKGDDGIVKRGSCSSGATWKLKAKPDDGRLEVEFEVDSNRSGQSWAVRVTDNGTQVFRGSRTTRPPSGSFSLERQLANRSGKDAIVATGTYSGQTCTARLSI